MSEKKVLVWGTGRSAKLFLKEAINCEIVGFVQSKKSEDLYDNVKVYEPDEIKELTWDVMIVASVYAEEIKITIDNLGIDTSKVVFLRYFIRGENVNANLYLLKDIVSEVYYNKIVSEVNCLLTIPRMEYDKIHLCEMDKIKEGFVYYRDYVRYRTFELIATEIIENQVQGAVAEAGVFRGTFSRLINKMFCDRKCYLFDTFEGFSKESIAEDVKNGYCQEGFADLFMDTDADFVLNSMPFKEECIVKKGYFPDTAVGLEEKFAFVSLDLDIESLIYAGLEYFYPRMEEGGYIFVHEYNYHALFGVKKAVERYEKDFGKIKKVPICDFGGSLVIMK